MSQFTIFSDRDENAIGAASFDPAKETINISELIIPVYVPTEKKEFTNITAPFRKGLVEITDSNENIVLRAECIPPNTPFGGYATFKIAALDGMMFAEGNFRMM
jgi:hypothetical protein